MGAFKKIGYGLTLLQKLGQSEGFQGVQEIIFERLY